MWFQRQSDASKFEMCLVNASRAHRYQAFVPVQSIIYLSGSCKMKAITFEPEWTPDHRQAIDLFRQGRSIFVTGSAGTGKTLLLNHLISIAGQHGVHRTALTGLAALNIQGTTLHKYVGCGLAKGSADQLFRTMSFSTKGRWRGTSVLFIDEVSMMAADLFEKLDQVCSEETVRRDL